MTIGRYTCLKRNEVGISQQTVANALGLNKSQIHRRETGEAGWRWAEIVKFAKLLNIKLSVFVTEFEQQEK